MAFLPFPRLVLRRLSAFPLALAGLIGSAGLAPTAALAYPNDGQRYAYESYGPPARPTYAPVPVNPYGYRGGYDPNYNNSYRNGYNNSYDNRYNNPYGRPYSSSYDYPIASEPAPYGPPPVRSCNRGTVLTGAAIGGGLGAMLANNSRNRLWSLPVGAAMGGILGGVISGC